MTETYVRYTEDVNIGGRLIPEQELNEIIEKFSEDTTEKAAYTSVYTFKGDALEYYNTHKTGNGTVGSLSGYDGPAIANHLIFDLDSENLDKSLSDAESLVSRLTKDYKFNPDSVSIFFSGGKGFHIKVKVGDALTNEQLKTICTHVAKGLETFDPKIYNKTRLIRIVNTKHEKTGLYKVEIPMASFSDGTVEDIKTFAKEPGLVYSHTASFLPEELLNLAPVSVLDSIEVQPSAQDITELDFSLRPANMPYCKFAILNGFFREGSRNDCLLAMASYYKSHGYPMEVTNQNLIGIIEVQEKRYPTKNHFTRKELWDTTVSYVYGPNYKGGVPNCKTNATMKAICMATGMHDHCSGNSKDNLGIQSIEQLDDSYVRYINTLDSSLIKTGITFLDKNVKLIKGTSNYIAGRSGSGKTNLILSTFRNTNKSGINSIFFSADTSAIIVYQRMVASVTGLDQQTVEDIYKSKDKKKIAEFKKAVEAVYGRTTFNVKSSISIDIIRDSIKQVEADIGETVDFVVIDYNERVMNQYSDPMQSVRHTALNLVDISRELNKCFVTIAQVSRSKGTERTPLMSKNAAKESGAVEESANALITIWRPLYATEDDRFIGVAIPKNRMGREGIQSILHFDGSTSIVRDAAEDEKKTCEYLTQELLEQEAAKNDGNNF